MPAVLLVLALCLGALGLAGQQLRLSDEAVASVRLLARGEPEDSALQRVRLAASGGRVTTQREGQFVCVLATAPSRFSAFRAVGLSVTARSCALEGGL